MGDVVSCRPGDHFEVHIGLGTITVSPDFSYRAGFFSFGDLADAEASQAIIQTDINDDAQTASDGKLIFSGTVPQGVTGTFRLAFVEIVRKSDSQTQEIPAVDLPDAPALDVTA
jgi:hypothetical protein